MAASIVRRIISTSLAPKPVGPYNQAVVVDNTMYISGQIGMDLSGNMVTGGLEAEAEQVMKNLEGIMKGAGSDMGNIIKTTVLLQDINDWPAVNTIYAKYFEKNFPARAAYAVTALPKGAKVEIEAVAVLGTIVDE